MSLAKSILAIAIFNVVNAFPLTADPKPFFIKPQGRGGSGQGVVVMGPSGCLILAPAHVIGEATEVEMWGGAGLKYVGSVVYNEPGTDIALIEPYNGIEPCDPIESGVDIDDAISANSLFLLTRAQSGDVTRTELRPIGSTDRDLRLALDRVRSRVTRGMSGSPLIMNGRLVGMLVEAGGDHRGDVSLVARRSDFIKRLLGTRLSEREIIAGTEAIAAPDLSASSEVPTSTVAALSDDRDATEELTIGAKPPISAVPGDTSAAMNFSWPVQGPVIRKFGEGVGGSRLDGIKIAVPVDTEVKSVQDGVVAYVGDGIAALGGMIIIRHGQGYASVYAHLSKLLVRHGQSVGKGQTIGMSGETGYADRPELHFEIRQGRIPIDPVKVLENVSRPGTRR